jgi:hypothetical protein
MKNSIKILTALAVLFAVLNCSKITEKVEQKVNEKVNEKIDENLKKIDSTFDKNKIDSLMQSLDSMKTKSDSLFDGGKKKLDKKNR